MTSSPADDIDMSDVSSAITYHIEYRHNLSDDQSGDLYDQLAHKALLMELLGDRFDELEKIDEFVLYMAVSLAEDPEAEHLNIQMNDYLRNLDSQQPTDSRISASIIIQEQGIEFIEDDSPVKTDHLSCLGQSFILRFEREGLIEDIVRAIDWYSQAIQICSNADKHVLLNYLGGAYLARFKHQHEISDITAAITYFTNATSVAPCGHPNGLDYLNNLAKARCELSRHSGDLDNLELAIEILNQCISLTPREHVSQLSYRLTNLGIIHREHFERLGATADINIAVEHQTKAISLLSASDTGRVHALISLGSSLLSRFDHLGEIEDINQAIERKMEAMLGTPETDYEMTISLHDLGLAYQSRFERLGRLLDIDEAIAYQIKAMLLVHQHHKSRSIHLTSLGTSYSLRFDHLGQISDLDEAIRYYHEALSETLLTNTRSPGVINNLATAYNARFKHLGDKDDIDQAILLRHKAASLMPKDHEDRFRLFSNLGVSHWLRFVNQKEAADINEAIAFFNLGLCAAPVKHALKPILLGNLAVAHYQLFNNTNDTVDIKAAVALSREALALTSDNDVHLAEQYFALGVLCQNEYEHFGDQAMVQKSADYFRRALTTPQGRPSTKVEAAWRLADIAPLLDDSLRMEAYVQAMKIFPQMVWLGYTFDHRSKTLSSYRRMFIDAVACAIEFEAYDVALEWVEQASSVIWKQTMQLRTPFDDLRKVNVDLAQRLEEVARSLDTDSITRMASPIFPQIPTELETERTNQRRHRLIEEWDELLEEARLIPGFSRFLQARTATELFCAVKAGSVVAFNIHHARCDALILKPGANSVLHLRLPDFSEEKAAAAQTQMAEYLRESGIQSRGVRKSLRTPTKIKIEDILSLLWLEVVKPVLDYLAYTGKFPSDNLPHVTWCSTGPLAFLPLHAAGIYEDSGAKVFDFVVSSYTPTISGLLAPPPKISDFSGILAVGQADEPGLDALPWVTSELSQLQDQAGALPFKRLEGPLATSVSVLSAMEQYSWVHLACHAVQNRTDPTKSAFRLHNGDLDLAKIAARSLKHHGFAFLSACQTATGDNDLPEQAMHLAAGIILAGYPTVVATMWSIHDEDAPLIAREVYADILKDGIPETQRIARALHNAMACLRNNVGENSFARWVPYIHLGI